MLATPVSNSLADKLSTGTDTRTALAETAYQIASLTAVGGTATGREQLH